MKIELDTQGPLSDLDLQILALLLPPTQTQPAPAQPAPAQPAPAQAAPAQAAPEADLPDPEPEKAPERVFEDEMDRVITKATDLVSQGKSSEIREVLAKIGVERVSAIESLEQLDAFEQALGPWL